MKIQMVGRSSILTAVATIVIGCTIDLIPTSTFASGSSNTGGGGGGVTGGTIVGGGSIQSTVLTSFKVTMGYYKSYGAVWTSYSVKAGSTLPIVRRTLTDMSTGQVVFENVFNYTSFVVDDDFLLNSRTYLVTIEVLDDTGTVLDSASALVTTPAPKIGP